MPNSSESTNEHEESDTASEESGPTETAGGGENEVPFDELPREDQLRIIFRNVDEVTHDLRSKWKEERIQVYFLLYSFAMTGAMFYLLYRDLTWVLIGAFAIYIVTIPPILSMSDQEEFFQADQTSPSTED